MKKTTQAVEVGGSEYETVAVSQTAQVLGTAGALGDFLARLVIDVITPATAGVTIIDGATSIVVQTGNASIPVGVKVVELGLRAVTGPWKITTGAGATVVAIGQFSV